MMKSLVSFGSFQSNTNLSRSISLSILDQNGNEISIETDFNDPNLIIRPMILQNITFQSS